MFTFFHEVNVVYHGLNLKRNACAFCSSYISTRIIKKSDYIATSIGHYASRMHSLVSNLKKIPIVPIPSNVPEKDITQGQLEMTRRGIAHEDEFIVAFFGRRYVKNSLAALFELIQEGVKLKILLIGNTMASCSDSPYVYKTGVLDINRIFLYLKIADCLVIPENSESGCSFKSGSLIAGLRAGKPIVTMKGIMTDELLQDGENILFVASDSIMEYKKKINMLLTDEEVRRKIETNALKISQKIDWTSTYYRYIEILKKKWL